MKATKKSDKLRIGSDWNAITIIALTQNDLKRILGSYNVASKQWIIRQYDHEVQGGSVVKPLVGSSMVH